jgi:hypothetical protein
MKSKQTFFLLILLAILAVSIVIQTSKEKRLERLYTATLEEYGHDLALLECLEGSRPCSDGDVERMEKERSERMEGIIR